ncbi:MAG TPA: hypothetical protein VMW32_03690 [Bacteroidales bacterium]|nr:hypothetical protein [Bacteroidales bacterium]
MKNIKKGEWVELTINVRSLLGLPDTQYLVKDILTEDPKHPEFQGRIVISSSELGKDWVQFVSDEEIILLL